MSFVTRLHAAGAGKFTLLREFTYLIIVFSFITLYALAYIGIFYLQIGTPTESSRWIYELSQKKLQRAASVQEKKILLVAGSNTLFGLRARLIEQETGIKTVNMAIHAGLGIKYILDTIKVVAKPGDMIIMPLEYDHYQKEALTRVVFVDYILSRDPDYFYDLSLVETVKSITALTVRDVFVRNYKKFRPDARIVHGYKSSTVDEFGDETLNKDASAGTAIRWRDGLARLESSLDPAPLNPAALELIQTFANWCREHDVRLLATFPSFAYFPDYQEPKQRKFFAAIVDFYREQAVSVLGTPYEFMYDKKDFFDTEYHLNSEAADRMTHQLITLLKSGYPAFAR